jgi:hypothetical protein
MLAILIADPRMTDRAPLVRSLERMGWDVWYAMTAEEAELSLPVTPFDFVVITADLSVSKFPVPRSPLSDYRSSARDCPVLILPAASADESDPRPLNHPERVHERRGLNAMVLSACKSFSRPIIPNPGVHHHGSSWQIFSGN